MPNPRRHRLGDYAIATMKPILVGALLIFVGFTLADFLGVWP
jgi:hypothetical protein